MMGTFLPNHNSICCMTIYLKSACVVEYCDIVCEHVMCVARHASHAKRNAQKVRVDERMGNKFMARGNGARVTKLRIIYTGNIFEPTNFSSNGNVKLTPYFLKIKYLHLNHYFNLKVSNLNQIEIKTYVHCKKILVHIYCVFVIVPKPVKLLR